MHGAQAVEGTATDAHAIHLEEPAEGVIDLSDVSTDPASLYAPAPAAATAPVVVADPEHLALVAAEVAETVARHREELAAAMAELTALQRTLRSEVRAVVDELDRIAAGVAPAAVEAAVDEHAAAGSAPTPKRARWRLRAARA